MTHSSDLVESPLSCRTANGIARHIVLLLLLSAVATMPVAKGQPPNDTALYKAVIAGDGAKVRQLILDGADVNARDKRGRTPLMVTAGKGQAEIVEMLLAAGARVNAKMDGGTSALQFAAWSGDDRTVKALLGAGADPNAQSKSGTTALEAAAGRGYQEIVRMLLAAGADVDKGEPIIAAAGNGHYQIVRTLLAAGADVNAQKDYGRTALSAAAGGGHRGIVRMLLDAGADVDKGKALIQAAWYGYNDIVRTLIDAGADINVQNPYEGTPLFAAAKNDHYETVRLLLAVGADPRIMRGSKTAMSTTYDPRIIYALFRAGDNISHLNKRLLLDLAAAIPTLVSILLGVVAAVVNRSQLKNASMNHDRSLRLKNNRRMYYLYLFNTIAFFMAYIALVFFPRSRLMLYVAGFLLLGPFVSILVNQSNKLAFPERYSELPTLLSIAGIVGFGLTSFSWCVLHLFD